MSNRPYLYREASASTELLDIALAKAQAEFKPVKRNRKGPYGMFADLCAMQEATAAGRAKYELAVKQYFIEKEGGAGTFVTELAHKGQFHVSAIHIPHFTNPQHTHSYVTYMARLGYGRILCLAVDDGEDGEDLAAGEPGGGDTSGILAAISQATSITRLDQLWKSVKDMNLPKPQMTEVEKAFREQGQKLEQMTKKAKEKPNADSK